MTEIIVGVKPQNGVWPAGYYQSEQKGSHEDVYIHTVYYGEDIEEGELPPFTYWREPFPEDENTRPWYE